MMKKISKACKIPVQLDLAEFVKESDDPSVLNTKYQLYGLVNH